MKSSNIFWVGSVLCLAICGIGQASYIHGYVWDYTANFSETDNPAEDSEGNDTWEYRTGAYNVDPLNSTPAVWDGTVGGVGAWVGTAGSPDSSSWIGSGFMKVAGGGTNQTPFLAWISNVDSLVRVDITVSEPTVRYSARVSQGNITVGEQSGSSDDFHFSEYLTVQPGDRIFLSLTSVRPAEQPQADVSFTVTMVPEPLTLGLLAMGAVPVLLPRRRG